MKTYKWVPKFQGEEQRHWCLFWVSKTVDSNDIRAQIDQGVCDIWKINTNEISLEKHDSYIAKSTTGCQNQ
jgi:hypothetical protein